jgi:hypothetical protein
MMRGFGDDDAQRWDDAPRHVQPWPDMTVEAHDPVIP